MRVFEERASKSTTTAARSTCTDSKVALFPILSHFNY